MTIFILFLLLLFSDPTQCVDPLESLIRNGWLMIKDYGEKMISNIAIPRTSDLPEQMLSFQSDPSKEKALNTLKQILDTCPQSFPVDGLKGTWHVTSISKRLLNTVFYDIHDAIIKLSTGKDISTRKSLFTFFKTDPIMRCIQFTVLDDSVSSPFECSYLSTDNQRQSIIGHISRSSTTQLSIHLASIIDTSFLVVYHSNSIIILSQTDTIPSCDNFLVIEQNPQNKQQNINDILISLGANTASNPIINMNHCNDLPKKLPPNVIIRPASQVNEKYRHLYQK